MSPGAANPLGAVYFPDDSHAWIFQCVTFLNSGFFHSFQCLVSIRFIWFHFVNDLFAVSFFICPQLLKNL